MKNQIEGIKVILSYELENEFWRLFHSESWLYLPDWIVLAEYFLEDCIQMTHFVPPPKDKKKKEKDDDGFEDDDVSESHGEFSLGTGG